MDSIIPTSRRFESMDEALRDDIRLLGRILGETIRAFDGDDTYGLIERIRQLAVRFHRDHDFAAETELEETLTSLSEDQINRITRAFGYFSILANIAEDHHHTRRWRAHLMADSPPREGSLAAGIARARADGFDTAALRNFFATATIAPVLTAHPTEVQRRSILDSLDAIAAQKELPALNCIASDQTTYFCGSYFKYGFHEDAFTSGLECARAVSGEPIWT